MNRNDALLSPRVTRRLITRFVTLSAPRAVDPERLAVLTKREREVMALVVQGLSNEEIGQRLFMSPATAKTHVSRAMLKLGARDRAQLVVLAYQTGLVIPEPHSTKVTPRERANSREDQERRDYQQPGERGDLNPVTQEDFRHVLLAHGRGTPAWVTPAPP